MYLKNQGKKVLARQLNSLLNFARFEFAQLSSFGDIQAKNVSTLLT